MTFRGEPVEVVYEDMGYQPDCNAHDIEWAFAHEPYNSVLRLTDDEEQSVYDQLRALGEVVDPEEEARWAQVLEPEEGTW